MNKFGIYIDKPKISIEEHLSNLDQVLKEAFEEIRRYVMSLGPDVIEEVRPHRVVYSKSFAFRNFLDIQPMNGSLRVEVKMNSRMNPEIIIIRRSVQLDELKSTIRKAYITIQ